MKMAFEELVEKIGFVAAVVVTNKLSEDGFLNSQSLERLWEIYCDGSFDREVREVTLRIIINKAGSFEKMLSLANPEQLTEIFKAKATSWRQRIQKKLIWKTIFKKAETTIQLKDVCSNLDSWNKKYTKPALKEILKREYSFDQWRELCGGCSELTKLAHEKMIEKAETIKQLESFLYVDFACEDELKELVIRKAYEMSNSFHDYLWLFNRDYPWRVNCLEQLIVEKLFKKFRDYEDLLAIYHGFSNSATKERVLKEIVKMDLSFEQWERIGGKYYNHYTPLTHCHASMWKLALIKMIETAKKYDQLQIGLVSAIPELRQPLSKKMAELAETLEQCIEVCNHGFPESQQIVMAKMSQLLK